MAHASTVSAPLAVVAVSREGATVRNGDATYTITWAVLDDACAQDDTIACYYRGIAAPPQDDETRRLASTYRTLRAQAQRMVHEDRSLPIVLWLTDSTNTGYRWVLTARTVDGSALSLGAMGLIGRAEGGTMLRIEADELREAVRDRLRARGYRDIREGREQR